MAAVKPMRGSSKRRVSNTARPRLVKSPLDRAAGWELVWPQVSPLFDAARPFVNPCFVYFIGEEDNGPVKIGSAKDPVLRLRGLQTGNPRRLQVEHVLLGDVALERLLHEVWEPFAIRSKRGQKVDALPGTEWFTGDIRLQLQPILKTAAEWQVEAVQTTDGSDLTLADLEHIVRTAHSEHDYVPKGRDEVRLLGAQGGVVVRRRSRL